MKAIIKIEAGNQSQECVSWMLIYRDAIIYWMNKSNFVINSVSQITGPGINVTAGYQIECSGNDLSKLKSEIGVHRLVRVSPFDRQKRRHTSFIIVSGELDGAVIEGNPGGTVCKGVEGKKHPVVSNAIRSYVLNPYKLVKDHRTGYTEPDVDSVFAGNFDGFMGDFCLYEIEQRPMY